MPMMPAPAVLDGAAAYCTELGDGRLAVIAGAGAGPRPHSLTPSPPRPLAPSLPRSLAPSLPPGILGPSHPVTFQKATATATPTAEGDAPRRTARTHLSHHPNNLFALPPSPPTLPSLPTTEPNHCTSQSPLPASVTCYRLTTSTPASLPTRQHPPLTPARRHQTNTRPELETPPTHSSTIQNQRAHLDFPPLFSTRNRFRVRIPLLLVNASPAVKEARSKLPLAARGCYPAPTPTVLDSRARLLSTRLQEHLLYS
ncbi:hypothetical protein E2P81_ATG02540 [Venturia nashicola]|nr:hypothetical protein E2P81_ATG02540 [Venturia nashicola]